MAFSYNHPLHHYILFLFSILSLVVLHQQQALLPLLLLLDLLLPLSLLVLLLLQQLPRLLMLLLLSLLLLVLLQPVLRFRHCVRRTYCRSSSHFFYPSRLFLPAMLLLHSVLVLDLLVFFCQKISALLYTVRAASLLLFFDLHPLSEYPHRLFVVLRPLVLLLVLPLQHAVRLLFSPVGLLSLRVQPFPLEFLHSLPVL